MLSGMDIESLELVLDKKTNIPLELNIRNEKDKIWAAITYKVFNINEKIDEKVFAF
ncbi:hypothetical protein D3C76_1884840 [compost metagenome]